MEKLSVTERTKLHRLPARGSYDTNVIYGILDDNFICNVAVNISGYANIIPTAYGRKGDKLYIHGSNKNRIFQVLKNGEDACIAVSTVDGLVLARSAFHQSVNYRSVIIYGKAEEVVSADEKLNALKAIMDRMIKGRWEDVRQPNEKELNATTVLQFSLTEASAKIRNGFPSDDKEDLELPVWAGVVPLKRKFGIPVNDEFVQDSIEVPEYVKNL